MDKYIYIQSDDSDAFFKSNELYHFRIHLDTPLTLEGFWKIGLLEFNAFIDTKKIKKNIHFLTKVCMCILICVKRVLYMARNTSKFR